MVPDRSSRSMRARTVARETPSSVASAEMLCRPLWRSSAVSFVSISSIAFQFGNTSRQNVMDRLLTCQDCVFNPPRGAD